LYYQDFFKIPYAQTGFELASSASDGDVIDHLAIHPGHLLFIYLFLGSNIETS
jgi:hypothetical protein